MIDDKLIYNIKSFIGHSQFWISDNTTVEGGVVKSVDGLRINLVRNNVNYDSLVVCRGVYDYDLLHKLSTEIKLKLGCSHDDESGWFVLDNPYFGEEKRKLFESDVDEFIDYLDDLKNSRFSNKEFCKHLIELIYTYIPCACLYKGDNWKTLCMIVDNLDDYTIIKKCLL